MEPDPQRRHVRVTTPCTREQIQEIRMRAGDSVAVGHRNQQHPAFVWCATEDGHHGWVPEDYLSMTGAHSAVARRDYDSTHLTAGEAEDLEVLERVDAVSYTHLRAHETPEHLVCRLLLEKNKQSLISITGRATGLPSDRPTT